MNNKKYLELIACFMIGLVLTIPFYVSSVMAQESDDEIPDATQACIEKNEETSGLADLMESGVIDYIEKILQMLHAVSTIWESVKFIWNGVIIVLYDTIFGQGIQCRIRIIGSFENIIKGNCEVVIPVASLPINRYCVCGDHI